MAARNAPLAEQLSPEDVSLAGMRFRVRMARLDSRDERHYLYTTWQRSYANLSRINRRVYDEHHPRLIERLIARSQTLLLCSPEVESTILAWACAEPPVLHYAYVPKELRRQGFARELITRLMGEYPDRIECTHRWPFHTTEGRRFAFVPYRLLSSPSPKGDASPCR